MLCSFNDGRVAVHLQAQCAEPSDYEPTDTAVRLMPLACGHTRLLMHACGSTYIAFVNVSSRVQQSIDCCDMVADTSLDKRGVFLRLHRNGKRDSGIHAATACGDVQATQSATLPTY